MEKKKKTQFKVTVGYKAVVCFTVKAETEEEAKKIILERVRVDGIYTGGEIQDETYGADGILNMDKTWNMVNS